MFYICRTDFLICVVTMALKLIFLLSVQVMASSGDTCARIVIKVYESMQIDMGLNLLKLHINNKFCVVYLKN